jgi:hypothetical protein
VLRALQTKWQQHDELMARMAEIIRQYGLNHEAAADTLKRTIGCARTEERRRPVAHGPQRLRR